MSNSRPDCHKGYLYKWTNYIKGYQKRWFVLSNGLLSYYRNKNEVSHTCRGTINLSTSIIRKQDSFSIVISNDSNQTFHLKAQSESETNQWLTALHLAKDTAISLSEGVIVLDDSDSEVPLGSPYLGNSLTKTHHSHSQNILPIDQFHSSDVSDISLYHKEFEQRLFDLNTSVTLVKKTSESLLNVLKDVNKLNSPHIISNYSINSDSSVDLKNHDHSSLNSHSSVLLNTDQRAPSHASLGPVTDLMHKFKEKNKTFFVATQACVNSCSEFANRATFINSKYQKLLNNEREQRLRLEKMVEELAKQLGALEKKAVKQLESESIGLNTSLSQHPDEDKNVRVKNSDQASDDSDDEYFYDAIEDEHVFNVSLPRPMSQNNVKLEPKYTINEYESCSSDSEYEKNNSKSNSVARVIVRSTENKCKSNSKNKTNNTGDSSQFHRRTVSSGFPSQSLTPSNSSKTDKKQSENFGSDLYKVSGDVSTFSELKSAHSVPSLSTKVEKKPARVRRTKITPRPNMSINLWGIMKNCIGKELSKIPVPVNFNEPLSMIQRLTEDFEYSDCLDAAAECDDSLEQLSWVAAFTVSSYSTTTNRTGKPFNPLLGETFEFDRTDDLGWRSLAEQVSHHPPAASLHCESIKGWKCWQEFTMSSKFRGKYLAIIPMGIAHLTFEKSNNHYTWRKVTSTVHNIIVGKLWIDNHGEMDIYNHKTGETCHLNYKAYSYFSKEPARRVTGVITDKNGVTKYVLNGTWDSQFQRAKVLQIRKDKNNQQVFETGPAETLWSRRFPPEYTSEMYNFTNFALELNEPEENVAPTDTRLRPDQRLMEKGFWDEANKEKERLEEKQREKRRNREKEMEQRKVQGLPPIEEHKPVWFAPVFDEETKTTTHIYSGNYWETKATGSWSSDLPDIF